MKKKSQDEERSPLDLEVSPGQVGPGPMEIWARPGNTSLSLGSARAQSKPGNTKREPGPEHKYTESEVL